MDKIDALELLIKKQQETIDNLKNILNSFPEHLYWKDKDGVYLGSNFAKIHDLDLSQDDQFLGQTDQQLPWEEGVAASYREHDLQVINEGKSIQVEESMTIKGKRHIVLNTRAPLRDKYHHIIGVVGISIDISKYRQQLEDKEDKLHNLSAIIANMPGFVYWKDSQSIYRGCNKNLAVFSKLESPNDIVGKTDDDFSWGREQAQQFIYDDKEILRTGRIQTTEYELPEKRADGKNLYVRTDKSPLYSRQGDAVGILGVAVDITDQKLAESLRLMSQVTSYQLEEQKKFQLFVEQVAHDIRSPLSSILMLSKSCKAIPEDTRIALRQASNTIADIAESLLERYYAGSLLSRSDAIDTGVGAEKMLLSLQIVEVLTSKRYQYKEKHIVFVHDIEDAHYFLTTDGYRAKLNRMLSNLIDNAVDACDKKESKIRVQLTEVEGKTRVTIQDNGSGISADILDQLRRKIPTTANKSNGHGLGLQQVRDTLDAMQGEMTIESTLGQGTMVQLDFPQTDTPDWLITQLVLNRSDKVLILDDDPSIHLAWDKQLEPLGIKPRHFSDGKSLLAYVALRKQKKDNLFLLTDYELIDQSLHGIDIIKKAGIKRTLLVTSHYNNKALQKEIVSLGSQICPKNLAHHTPIIIKETKQSIVDVGRETVDFVLLDDDVTITDHLCVLFKTKRIDVYHSGLDFFENLEKYPEDTLFFLDNQLRGGVTGLEIADTLYKQGYERLYLFSAKLFKNGELPRYVTLVDKLDIGHFERIIEGECASAQYLAQQDTQQSSEDFTQAMTKKAHTDLVHDLMTPLSHTSLLLQQLKSVIAGDHKKKSPQELVQLTDKIDCSLKFACNFSKLRLANWQRQLIDVSQYHVASISTLLNDAIKRCPFSTMGSSFVDLLIEQDFDVYTESTHFHYTMWHVIKEAMPNKRQNHKKVQIIASVSQEGDTNCIEFKDFFASDFLLKYYEEFVKIGGGTAEYEVGQSNKLSLYFPKIDDYS